MRLRRCDTVWTLTELSRALYLGHSWRISASSQVTRGTVYDSHEAICCRSVSPVHQSDAFRWEYRGHRVQGSATMAWPNTGAKSGLTGGGLSCRLAWRTVCLDHSEFGWAAAALQSWLNRGGRERERRAGTQIEEAEPESWPVCLGFTSSLLLAALQIYFHFSGFTSCDKRLDHLRG